MVGVYLKYVQLTGSQARVQWVRRQGHSVQVRVIQCKDMNHSDIGRRHKNVRNSPVT